MKSENETPAAATDRGDEKSTGQATSTCKDSTSLTDTTPVSIILARLDGVIDRGGGNYYACCPAHDDRSPSLSIGTGDDGRTLLHCFSGCATEAILDALGLTWIDLYPDRWEAARRSATARGVSRSPKIDPLELERAVLKIAAADLRAGKELSVEDRARVKVARLRLEAGRLTAGRLTA